MTTHLDPGEIVSLAWAQLWQVTLAALVLGGAAWLTGRRRPRLAYTLWMLVLFKALVPPVVSSPTGVFSWTLARQVASNAGERDVAAPPGILRGPENLGPVHS
jgi:hypothetical protein